MNEGANTKQTATLTPFEPQETPFETPETPGGTHETPNTPYTPGETDIGVHGDSGEIPNQSHAEADPIGEYSTDSSISDDMYNSAPIEPTPNPDIQANANTEPIHRDIEIKMEATTNNKGKKSKNLKKVKRPTKNKSQKSQRRGHATETAAVNKTTVRSVSNISNLIEEEDTTIAIDRPEIKNKPLAPTLKQKPLFTQEDLCSALRQTYRVGTICRIHSMVEQKQYNNTFCRIIGYKKSKGRDDIDIYYVKLLHKYKKTYFYKANVWKEDDLSHLDEVLDKEKKYVMCSCFVFFFILALMFIAGGIWCYFFYKKNGMYYYASIGSGCIGVLFILASIFSYLKDRFCCCCCNCCYVQGALSC